ncbi:hypothetical protein CQW23_01335 [Capsicum baccatum]|uniref:Ubiquitin-like protease family profile domain-containing protein n=1 Tax=Capsicum baccatum TaxID=33114 RepID=A0A2G2XNA5_CAPBA|nr:hypothetical protein CQW23_01335 [Capsicum baccatum]
MERHISIEGKISHFREKEIEAWAFDAIPYLRQQVNYQEEVSYLRILRWSSAKTDKNAKFLDLFNLPKKAIVHSWLVPTSLELKMSFFLTLRSVKTLSNPKVVDRIKIKLFGVTTITRKIILKGGLVAVDDGGCRSRATAEEHNITVDNPSTSSKEEEKVKPVCTDWSMTEEYWDKMGNPFDVQYIEGIAQQTIGNLDCGPFVAAYTEYLSDGLQVPSDGLDMDYSSKYMLLFYENMEKRKLRTCTQATLKIHDDQS